MASAVALVAVLAAVLAAAPRLVGEPTAESIVAPPAAGSLRGGPQLDPKRIEGASLCVDCHRSEVAHWMTNWRQSEHGWIGYSRLLGSRAEELAEDLEIDKSEITKTAVCVECHATPSLDYHGRMTPVLGVACEACHGESGGAGGWLNLHAVYGPPGTHRMMESPQHRDSRRQRAAAAGQLASSNIYAMARRCFNCHIVGDEELITKTDHQIEDRDFADFARLITSEKIRHNFHLDQSSNAEVATLWLDPHWNPARAADREKSVEARKKQYYVASVFAKAEVVLRLLSKVKDPLGDYAGDLSSLIDPGDLEDVLESVDLDEQGQTEAESLIEDLEDMELEDTAGDTDEDESLSAEEIEALRAMAARIEQFGQKLTRGDGDILEEVELP